MKQGVQGVRSCGHEWYRVHEGLQDMNGTGFTRGCRVHEVVQVYELCHLLSPIRGKGTRSGPEACHGGASRSMLTTSAMTKKKAIVP